MPWGSQKEKKKKEKKKGTNFIESSLNPDDFI